MKKPFDNQSITADEKPYTNRKRYVLRRLAANLCGKKRLASQGKRKYCFCALHILFMCFAKTFIICSIKLFYQTEVFL